MISANGVEYKNVPEQVQYLTEQVADIWTAIAGINPPDLTLYALKTYVDAADTALGNRITAVESSIGTLLTKTEAANTYAKIADIGTYINLSDYVKTTDMYTYVQAEMQNFDLDTNTDFTALKSRVSTLETSVSSMTSDIADANTTAANAQTAAGNAVNTANNASAVATNAYNTATSAASDVADMQTTINNYDSRIDAVESTVNGFQASLSTAQNTANAALTKAESALSMIAGLHSLTKQEVEFEGDSVTVAGFVEGSLCTLTKLEGDTRKSINIWDEEWEVGGIKWADGQNEVKNDRIRSKNYIHVASGERYALYIGKTGSGIALYAYDDNKNFIGYANGTGITNTEYIYNGTVTNAIPNNVAYIRFVTNAAYGTTYNHDICINISDVAINGTYYSYFDGLKSVSISGLSSGGGVVITTSEGTTSLVPTLEDDTLELGAYDYLEQVISGTQLTASLIQGGEMVDLGDFNYTYQSNFHRFSSTTALTNSVVTVTDIIVAISDLYTQSTSIWDDSDVDLTFGIYYGGTIYIRDLSVTSPAVLKAKLAGHKLYYKLATPVTTVLATVTYTDVSAFFEAGATITVNNANTEYDVESTSTMYGYVAE